MDFSWIKNLIEKITIKLNLNRVNSPNVKISTKTKNEINQAIIYQGLSITDAIVLIESVVDQKLMTFKNEAEEKYRLRNVEFSNLLTGKLKELPEDEISKLKDPDTQLALFEAAKISGRKQNKELREVLANLVINRIKNETPDKEELKNLVYNEAITTVGKLTMDQLKIITLCFLLRYTKNQAVISWETFNQYIKNDISPFLDFKNTTSEFEHIQYAGCANITAFGWNYISSIKHEYFYLFLDLIDKEKVDALDIEGELKNKVFILRTEDNKYYVPFQRKVLQEFLQNKNADNGIQQKILKVYDEHLKSDADIKKSITSDLENGKELIEILDKSQIKNMSLTSVGKAIATTYFEQVTGTKLNIDIWIN